LTSSNTLVRRISSGLVLLFAIASASLHAEEPTAAGLWRQIDDNTGKPSSILRIVEHNGVFEAFVEKIFFKEGETNTDPVCDRCTDSRHGQKILGMRIMTDLKREGLQYQGGEILDPGNGHVYRAKMQLSPDGRTLEVRGFIGVSLFGRSQTWFRE